jgi:hypothetical protein
VASHRSIIIHGAPGSIPGAPAAGRRRRPTGPASSDPRASRPGRRSRFAGTMSPQIIWARPLHSEAIASVALHWLPRNLRIFFIDRRAGCELDPACIRVRTGARSRALSVILSMRMRERRKKSSLKLQAVKSLNSDLAVIRTDFTEYLRARGYADATLEAYGRWLGSGHALASRVWKRSLLHFSRRDMGLSHATYAWSQCPDEVQLSEGAVSLAQV